MQKVSNPCIACFFMPKPFLLAQILKKQYETIIYILLQICYKL